VVPIGRKISRLNHKGHEATNRLIQEAKLRLDFHHKEGKGDELKKILHSPKLIPRRKEENKKYTIFYNYHIAQICSFKTKDPQKCQRDQSIFFSSWTIPPRLAGKF
jgi:hypothetical protein